MKRKEQEVSPGEVKRFKGEREKGVRMQLTSTSWVEYGMLPATLLPTAAEFEELWNLHPETFTQVKLFGKLVNTPRWSQTYGRSYQYSGMLHEAKPIPALIQRYLTWCQERYPGLNSCLVNWYQDGSHYISAHSDDERQLAAESEIHCLSFGAARDFILEHKEGLKQKRKIFLENGSHLVMGGTTQQTHKHSIPKAPKCTQRRISLTFRYFKDEK